MRASNSGVPSVGVAHVEGLADRHQREGGERRGVGVAGVVEVEGVGQRLEDRLIERVVLEHCCGVRSVRLLFHGAPLGVWCLPRCLPRAPSGRQHRLGGFGHQPCPDLGVPDAEESPGPSPTCGEPWGCRGRELRCRCRGRRLGGGRPQRRAVRQGRGARARPGRRGRGRGRRFVAAVRRPDHGRRHPLPGQARHRGRRRGALPRLPAGQPVEHRHRGGQGSSA